VKVFKPAERAVAEDTTTAIDRWLALRVGSPRYRSGLCTAIARFAGSNVVGFDPGAYAPGFMLSPAPQAKIRTDAPNRRGR
jgi:hypothetical protein